MEKPWLSWVPGVLNGDQVRELVKAGFIEAAALDCGPSAFDLPLDSEVWELREGAFKPAGPNYLPELRDQHLVAPCEAESDGAFRLKRGSSYVIRLQPTFRYAKTLAEAEIHGQATAKSTIGRLGVLVRFVLDGMTGYEGFGPDELGSSDGSMFVEVTPLSFDVRVKPPQALSQLLTLSALFARWPERLRMVDNEGQVEPEEAGGSA